MVIKITELIKHLKDSAKRVDYVEIIAIDDGFRIIEIPTGDKAVKTFSYPQKSA